MHFKTGSNIIIAGESQSGKSYLTANLILNKDSLFFGPPIKWVLYCCKNKKFIPPGLKEVPNFSVCEGIPSINDIRNNTLVILDDFLSSLNVHRDKITELFCISSHHCNLSIVLILQNFFCSKLNRDISLNAQYIVFMRSLRDKRSFSYLARQINPSDWRNLEFAYISALNRAYTHLCIDLSQCANELFRIKSNILNPDYFTTYIADDTLEAAAEKIFSLEDQPLYVTDAFTL